MTSSAAWNHGAKTDGCQLHWQSCQLYQAQSVDCCSRQPAASLHNFCSAAVRCSDETPRVLIPACSSCSRLHSSWTSLLCRFTAANASAQPDGAGGRSQHFQQRQQQQQQIVMSDLDDMLQELASSAATAGLSGPPVKMSGLCDDAPGPSAGRPTFFSASIKLVVMGMGP